MKGCIIAMARSLSGIDGLSQFVLAHNESQFADINLKINGVSPLGR